MSELTREMIRQHCLVLRDALGNLFPSIDDPSREYYWELLDELGKAALSALTARSEGFRQGVEAAAKVCDAYLWAPVCAAAILALSPRETDANVVGWVQEHKDGRKTFYAGDIDPREIHDNGMPTYQVYRLPPPPERP